jgi:hypothetical protein
LDAYVEDQSHSQADEGELANLPPFHRNFALWRQK